MTAFSGNAMFYKLTTVLIHSALLELFFYGWSPLKSMH